MLHAYHSEVSEARKSRFIGTSRKEMVGVEIEFTPTASEAAYNKLGRKSRKLAGFRLAAYLEDALSRAGINPEWFVFEQDASLKSPAHLQGVELISRPVAAKSLSRLPWGEFFDILQEEGIVRLGEASCGMHVHVDPFSGELEGYSRALWHRLAVIHDPEFAALFGRRPSRFCETFPEIGGSKERYSATLLQVRCGLVPKAVFAETEYSPLDLTGKTPEFRMFPSPKSGEEFLASLGKATKLGYPDGYTESAIQDPDMPDSRALFDVLD